MTTLNSAIKQYLSPAEINTLNSLYPNTTNQDEMSLQDKNTFFIEFINNPFINTYFPIITGDNFNVFNNFPSHIGSGTQGIVFSLNLKNLESTISKLTELTDLFNIKKSSQNIENQEVACKIQIINNPLQKYWESRMLREEFIMMKLNTFETIKKYIPKLYLGFTIRYNQNKFRITLMELFKPGRFENIQNILPQLSNQQTDIIINATRPLIYSLWRNGVSHNDISLRNILVDLLDFNNIKLIDFGLATMFAPYLDENNSNIEKNIKNILVINPKLNRMEVMLKNYIN
jgi:serine/threonine protein kinase